MKHSILFLLLYSFTVFSQTAREIPSYTPEKIHVSPLHLVATTAVPIIGPVILCGYIAYTTYTWFAPSKNNKNIQFEPYHDTKEFPFANYQEPCQEIPQPIPHHPHQKLLDERLTNQQERLKELQHEYQSIAGTEYTNSVLTQQKQRAQALHSYFKEPHLFYTKSYHISLNARTLLQHRGLPHETIEDLTACFGNRAQHSAYNECITIINELASIKKNDQLTDLDTLTLNLSILGCQAAKAGHVTQAYTLADFCWAALDCTKAVGLGVIDGVCATANTVMHPLQTVGNVANTVCTAAYYLGKVIYEVGDLSYTYYTDPHAAQDKWNRRCNQIKALGKALKKRMKEITIQDAIHFTVACTTETILTGKCLGALQQFYKVSKIKGLQFAEKTRAGHMVALTPDGIPVKVASKTSQLFSLMENVGEKVKNVVPKGIRKRIAPSGTKITKQFNSLEELIESAGKLKKLKKGTRQGFIQGDAQNIFQNLAKKYNAKINIDLKGIPSFELNNTTVHLYNSTTSGATTLRIDKAGKVFKLRITP